MDRLPERLLTGSLSFALAAMAFSTHAVLAGVPSQWELASRNGEC
jgi:hypothetical protein